MNARVFDAKEFVGSLPRRPGVYRMYNAAHEILYVGKARNLRDRVGTYFAASNGNPKVQALVGQIAAIEVTVANSETEALLLEYNLIKAHKPRFNVVLRDDKSLWPPYFVVPVIRREALEANPKIGEVLNRVSALLDEATMAQMNYQVDGEKLSALLPHRFHFC